MKLLYIGNVLSQELVDKNKLSIAGKKYELSLLKSLDNKLKDDLEIISINRINDIGLKYVDYLFGGKKYKILYNSKLPLISDLVLNINFIFVLFKWSIVNTDEKKMALVLNSPFGISLILIIFKIIFRIKIFSITIDTPFIKENDFSGLLGFYSQATFKLGHLLLRFFSGIAILNKNVIDVLKLRIPYIVTKIGTSPQSIGKYRMQKTSETENKNKVVYVGTLMKSKGIDLLLDAFNFLDPQRYQLIVCGDGPLKDSVIKYSEKNNHIIYKGRISDEDLQAVTKSAGLFINITPASLPNEDFSFPSKLIDYLLSGVPVLTNYFPALPKDFLDFVHVIDDLSAEGIKNAIEKVFSSSEEGLRRKCDIAYQYIVGNYSYDKIASELLTFMV